MYVLLFVFPLCGALVAGLAGRWVGRRGAGVVTTTTTLAAFGVSLFALYEIGLAGSRVHLDLGPWMATGLFDAHWSLSLDTLTAVMAVVVTGISTLVHLYSTSYMEEDPHLPRFISYLSLFTAAMVVLITGDNFVELFLGWEGVGLASYLLINFWTTRPAANRASIKAMLVNRVGDVGLALGIALLWSATGSVDYTTVWALAGYLPEAQTTLCGYPFPTLGAASLLLFVGAVGKSAQLGLHTWLPDAMEGPTPVSALIHAATMVTAGVYLLARMSPILEWAPGAGAVVALVGVATCIFAATTACVQNDLKRVIAYSTASQLGYMMLACGLGAYGVAVFHLATHACFKALLFLGAGSVIHALGDEQDLRRMGGLARVLPLTASAMTTGTMALVGMPWLAGFYSKDVILEVAGAGYTVPAATGYLLGALCVALTSYYSWRLALLCFWGPSRAPRPLAAGVHESAPRLVASLCILAPLSVVVGYLARDAMIGAGSPFWRGSLYTAPAQSLLIEAEWTPQLVKLLPLGAALAGFLLALFLCGPGAMASVRLKLSPLGRALYVFFNGRWLVDKVYNDWMAGPAHLWGHGGATRLLDRGVFEHVGPLAATRFARGLSENTAGLQTGLVSHYALVMVSGLAAALLVATLSTFSNLPLADLALVLLIAAPSLDRGVEPASA